MVRTCGQNQVALLMTWVINLDGHQMPFGKIAVLLLDGLFEKNGVVF